jgi:uridylate kinase
MIVRNYIKNLPLTNAQKEVIALDLIKANSRMLAYIMGARLVEAVHDLSNYTFTVLPALAPGQSTDADAAIAAEFLGAQLIILTDVGGIYDKDPKVHKDAKLYKKMTFQQLANFCVYQEYSPVSYGVLDHLAAKLIIRSEIETIVMSGVNPNKIIEALNGKVDGTIISKSD